MVVFLVFIILILGGITSYLIYGKWFKEELEVPEESKKEELSLEDSLVKTLYSYVSFGQDFFNKNYYFLENKKVEVAAIPNDKKFFYAFPLIDYNQITKAPTIDFVETFSIPEAAYEDALEKLFGPNVTYQKEGTHQIIPNWSQDITKDSWGFTQFQYDKDQKVYVGTTSGIGGGNPLPQGVYRKLISAIKEKNKITVTEKFIYVESNYETSDQPDQKYRYKVYADINKTSLIEQKNNVSLQNTNQNFSIDPYLNQANTATYVFELGEDQEYHFVSSQVEK